jgi:hypothetical protein
MRNELRNEFPNIFEKIVFTSLDFVKEAFLLLKKRSNKL